MSRALSYSRPRRSIWWRGLSWAGKIAVVVTVFVVAPMLVWAWLVLIALSLAPRGK